MAGSEQQARSTERPVAKPARDTAGPNELVQIAIVYNWTSVTIYRNGAKYACYDIESRQVFPRDMILLIGKQRLGCDKVSMPTLAGTVEEARLYNVALSPKMIAALKPNEPSPIGPVGQWTFEDGTARDSTGHFPMGQLQGNARIAGGKLILDGQESFLVVPLLGVKQPTLISSSDFERGFASWYGQKRSGDGTLVPAPRCFPRNGRYARRIHRGCA